jgi:hypothetical protein
LTIFWVNFIDLVGASFSIVAMAALVSLIKEVQMTQTARTVAEGIERLSLVERQPVVELGPFEIEIEVRAAALNFFDLLILVGRV